MLSTLSTVTLAFLLIASPSSTFATQHSGVKRSHAVLARGFGGMESADGNNLMDRSLGSRIGGETVQKRAVAFGKRSLASVASSLLAVKQTTNMTVYSSVAMWYLNANAVSACGNANNDTELTVGLPLAFWANTSIPSNLCGQTVVVTNLDNGKNVTAIVGDATGKVGYTSLSKAAFGSISNMQAGIFSMSFYFVNPDAVALANSTTTKYDVPSVVVPTIAGALVLTVPVRVPSPALNQAASTVTPAMVMGLAVSQADAEIAAASAASVASIASASSASVQAAAASASASASASAAAASASADAAWQASQAAASSSAAAAWAWEQSSSSSAAAAAATQSNNNNNGGQVYSGGDATFFYQNGVAGACGVVHSEQFYGIAIDQAMYAGGSNCWRYIEITNTQSGAKVTAQVVDMCPTCNSGTSLDLSVGAFNAIASESQGMVPISWKFV